jgi:ammonium transporter
VPGVPDTGDTAWMLTATALVLLMTPGLALFYGGMVRSKSVLNMMMMSFASMGLVGVLWVLYGYSMTFGTSVGDAGVVGDPAQFAGLQGLTAGTYLADAETGAEVAVPLVGTIPSLVFVGFQATFAIITVALISGAVADRMKFGSWLVFAGIWVSVVYFPVAHWVFNFDDVTAGAGGWIANDLAAIDFAGGTAVHINAGIAALVLAIVLGKRRGWPREPMRPHNLTLVMLGAALLWFGWFGFNAGSAVGSGAIAGFAFLNTIVATAAAMIAWLLVERSATATRRASVPPPASSRASSRSPRPAPRSPRWARSPSVSIAACTVRPTRSAGSTSSATTTRSTSSASTSSPASGHPGHRVLRHRRSPPTRPTVCSTAAASTSSGARPWPRSPRWCTAAS